MSAVPDSVGLVKPERHHFPEPLPLACGRSLPEFELVYETYGELNADKSNALLICHTLSSDHHVAGFHAENETPGWWEDYVGPGKAIDTREFFVVCPNNIGGCFGSTGPNSLNPETGRPWGPDFPPLRVRDWVSAQKKLMEALDIEQWAAIVGPSIGGMQVMRWALEHPACMRHCVVVASAMKLSAQNIAFNEIARRAISSDPDFHDGRYMEHDARPRRGLAIARMIGHLTYLSDTAMAQKFGRELRRGTFERGIDEDVQFQVESYLQHQGDKFSQVFDANTYLLTTRALDYFDLAREYNHDPVQAFGNAQSEFFIVSFSSDWRFLPQRSREIVQALIRARKKVSYAEVEADQGHDAFLLDVPRFHEALRAYMHRVAEQAR